MTRNLSVANRTRRAEKGPIVEMDQFDDLTRRWGGAGFSRRRALGALGALLVGSPLAALAGRFGPAETAEAKPGRRRRKPRAKRAGRAAAQDGARRLPSGGVQGEGKHKGKGKGKGHHKPPKPRLCDTLCADEGGHCCRDGSCAAAGDCCPDQWQCANGSCVAQDQCCPDEKRCGDGSCITRDQCCSDAEAPACDSCSQAVCEDGERICRTTCQTSDAVCCQGACYSPCSNGCQVSDDCGSCATPPAGTVYCAAQDRCVSPSCPAGQDFDSATCQCKDHCPALISRACAPVPARDDWKGTFGDPFPLPQGCCGARYWFEDWYGDAYCSTPGGVEPRFWRCDG